MITSNDISILIVTRVNNSKRIDAVYNRIRQYYPTNEIIIVYDNVDYNINVLDDNLKQIVTKERVYVSGGYNIALKQTSKKCFAFLHDDTFIHKDFINNLLPHLNKNIICNFTTIEPPLFDNKDVFIRPIQNFGYDLDDLNLEAFDSFCDERNSKKYNPMIENSFGGFFMAGYVSTLLDIGGFDENFKPFFFEDSDLIFRLHLNGIKFKQILNSLVYHLVSLTSRKSEDGDTALKLTEAIFLNKWKVPFNILKEYTMKQNIEYKNVRIKLQIKNLENKNLLNYLNCFSDIKSEYPCSILHIDGKTFTEQDLNYVQILPYIISENSEYLGEFKLNNMILEINPKSILEPIVVENNL